MNQVLIINPDNLDNAFSYVRKLSIVEASPELRAIKDSAVLLGKISDVWDSIESVIRKAYIHGKEKVEEAVGTVMNKVNQLIQEADKQAKDVHDVILKKLQAFIKNLIDGAVSLIPLFINIGNIQFPINKVSYGQKLVLGGSLQLNLLEIISITSSGEMQITVEYIKGSNI